MIRASPRGKVGARGDQRVEPGRLAASVELLHLPPIGVVLLATTGFTVAAANGWPPLGRLATLLASTLLGQLAISVHNDYCDRALDAQAKPWRALPRGLLTPAQARAWTATLAGLSLAAAVPLGLTVVFLVAVGMAAGFAYNARLKRTAWTWLPFWVALPTLPLNAFATVGRWEPHLWLVYVIGAPLVLSVYIADTLADLESDRVLGVRGLAHRLGPGGARLTCWAALVLAQGLALALWPAGHTPGPLFYLSLGALLAGVWLDRRGLPSGHWLAIMAGVVSLALGWVMDLAR